MADRWNAGTHGGVGTAGSIRGGVGRGGGRVERGGVVSEDKGAGGRGIEPSGLA